MNLKIEAEQNIKAKPILKWAGGKTQLLEKLISSSPKKYNKYIEPFFGGGALFFGLEPQNAVIADLNGELINLYKVLSTNVEEVIYLLKDMPNDKNFFLDMRRKNPSKLTNIERAARLIYLNKTCFNGLYRENKKGEFNVPFGNYKNPNICNVDNLIIASEKLARATILQGDYKEVLEKYAEPGDFIFLDPPYLPVSKYSDFNRYTKMQFGVKEHYELASEVKRLHEMGCHVLLTNSNTPLVHDLYADFEINVLQTKRNINNRGNNRTGEDVLVKVEPKPKPEIMEVSNPTNLSDQVYKYPSTRFMGSKSNLLENIWSVASRFEFETVTDLFSGSGIVSYMFKAQGKQVISNDYMTLSSTFSQALIENNKWKISENDLNTLLSTSIQSDNFVTNQFKDLYFSEKDNQFIDKIRATIPLLSNKYKRSLAMASLTRACMKKRPRGIFTFTGNRYNDGRRDLTLSLEEHFLEAIKLYNNAVFDNDKKNVARNGDAMSLRRKSDLVYIDPPYFSPFSDNDYVRRYHFVEGLAREWRGLEIQENTKTKKFKNYPTPFNNREGVFQAFDRMFKKHKESILMVSYSSNSIPSYNEMKELLYKYKSEVEVYSVDHNYSFGNKENTTKNKVKEYLFIAR